MASKLLLENKVNRERGELIRKMRLAMQMKLMTAAALIRQKTPNMSRKEQGLTNVADWEVSAIKDKFVVWREQEVKRLQGLIDDLNAIV